MLKRLLLVPKVFNSNLKIPLESDSFENFSDLNLPPTIQKHMEQFPSPSEIQAKSMKILLEGHDLVGIAPTGSGKTLSFAIPAMIKSAAFNKQSGRKASVSTVIVCPTRQLSNQITEAINPLARSLYLRTANLFGGAPKREQFFQARSANIIVATPGRLHDYITGGAANKLQDVQSLILDEADRMLEMNFQKQLIEIEKQTPKTRQTMLFSATWDRDIELLATQYIKPDAYYVQIGKNTISINPNIEQHFRLSSPQKVKQTISQLLNGHPNSKVLIFCNTKQQSRQLAFELNDMTDKQINYITSDLSQEQRMDVMDRFRNTPGSVMVATDVASRGIDVKDIELVINYGFPQNNADLIHRIGRTGRGGKSGKSLTFIFKGGLGVEKSLRYIASLFQNQNLPIPQSLKDILEEVGIQTQNNRKSYNKQPTRKSSRDRNDRQSDEYNSFGRSKQMRRSRDDQQLGQGERQLKSERSRRSSRSEKKKQDNSDLQEQREQQNVKKRLLRSKKNETEEEAQVEKPKKKLLFKNSKSSSYYDDSL